MTPADGSTFADGTTGAKTLATGEDGTDSLVAELVVGGSYTIAEVKAPDGYTKIDGTLTVTVRDDGSIRVAEGATAPAEFVISDDGTVQVFTGTVKNDPTKLTLSKTDKETNQSLAGATFELAGKFADGSASQTLDATEDATVELDKALLIADGQTKYTLTETAAPGGYEVILQPLVFTVATDGTITPDDPQAAEEAGWTVGRDGISVTASDVPIEVDLSKLGEDSGTTELTGAEFLVKPAKGSAFANAAEGENENGIAVTPENIGTVLAHKLKVGNTYTLEETLAPTGYEVISDELAFTVSDDGTLQKESGSDAWAISANGMVAVITATDRSIEVALQKTSASDSAKVLSGATFELYKGASIDAGAWLSEVTTGEDGTIGLTGLVGGETYTLRETQAPAGYELLPDATFTVAEDGTVEFTGSHDGYSVADSGGVIAVTAADEPIEAQLVKTDETGMPLAGAVFKIEGTFAGEYADQTSIELAATNADGIVQVPSAALVAGATYTVTEVTAPDGYELAGSVEFAVGADGAVQIAGASADAPAVAGAGGSGSYAASADGGTAVVTAIDAPVEIAIDKVSAADGGTHLDGAVFEVTGVFAGAQDEETREYTTASDGALVGISNISAELKSGQTYTLREKTAPAGYELIEGTLAFAVAEDGTVSAVGDVPAGYGISADKVSIVASDAPIEVQFGKRGLADDGDLLTGGKFTISGTFVNDATHKTSRQEIPFTTGSDATAIGKLPHEGATYSLVAGETYTVVEDAAPAGYEKLGAFSFKVDEHGVIASAEGSATAPAGEPGYAISDEGGTVTLTAHDRPIGVTLAKAGSNTEGALLGGAVFELFRVDGAADSEQLASMGDVEPTAEGAVELSGIVAGNTYVLHEKTAPEGYELMDDVRFTVDVDGAVAFEEAPAGWAVANGDDGIAAITATDEPVEMQIVKTDGAGTPLDGAVFEVRPADGSAFAGAPELNGNGALEVGATGSDGAASVPAGVLVAGNTYVIDEVTAPDGYELAGSVEFTVGADGAVQIAGASADAPAVAGAGGSGSYTASADGGTAVVTAADAPVELVLAKTDGGETVLPGAEFTATEVMADGQVGEPQVVTAVTGDGGTAVLTGLIAGKTYVLAETKAPAGYELLSDTLRFTVRTDGTIDAGWFPPAAFEVGQGGDSVAVADEPLLVSFVKQAPNGAPLSGAEFTVEGPFPDGSSSKTFTSDESGTVFDKMQLVGSAEGTVYTVTETKAPDGYLLPDGSLSLVVYDDGTVAVGDGTSSALKDAASVSDEGGVAVVALENEPAPGTPLPQTGDPLKLVFAVIALAAAASLSAFSVMLRRRRRQ